MTEVSNRLPIGMAARDGQILPRAVAPDYAKVILDTARRWAHGTNIENDERINPAANRDDDLANLRQLERALTLDGGARAIPGTPELVCAVRRLDPRRKPAVHDAVHALITAIERDRAQGG